MRRLAAILLATASACVGSQGSDTRESGADEGPRREASAPATPEPALGTANEPLTITFVGDVIEGRYRDWGHDPIAPPGFDTFGRVRDLLRADVVVVNLETPIVSVLPARSPAETRHRFGATAQFAATLRAAGVTVASLANNHWYDLGEDGQLQTPVLLAAHGILAVGASQAAGSPFRVVTLERRGRRLGFIAATTRRNGPPDEGSLRVPYASDEELVARVGPQLRAARPTHDLLIVLLHWGNQYRDEPEDAQVTAAHALVGAGADLIVGHHPHVLQGVERHEGALIAYSLGNFAMEHTGRIPRLSGVLRVSYGPGSTCPSSVRFHPVLIRRTPFQHPIPAAGHSARDVRRRLRALSAPMGSDWAADEGAEDLILEGSSRCP